jgi:type II secretory pathway pseudopilin PulG
MVRYSSFTISLPGPHVVRPRPPRAFSDYRRGLTLIEVMVSLAAAMVVLAAVISVLGMVTKGVADSRSMIEATGRLRSAQMLLRSDLAGATNSGLVMQKGEMGNGYIEIVDGSTVDDNGDSLRGDVDDIIALTTRTSGAPFVGQAGNNTITSPVAEVVWFLDPSPARTYGDGTVVYNLHRRIFLVLNNTPDITNQLTNANFNTHDVTFRQKDGNRIPCSLNDLTQRRHRVFHNNSNTAAIGPQILSGNRQGEDIVLTNVLAFDVKVFDPTATNKASGNDGLIPGDRGYNGATTNAGNGAYVDLGQGKGNGTRFNKNMNTKSQITGNPTYDTWSFDYEYGGPYVDGLDLGGEAGVVDDFEERQTMPPYPYPLRGVQIKIRVYEPSSKQVREVTVEETFVP